MITITEPAAEAVATTETEIKFPSLHIRDIRGEKKHMLTITKFAGVKGTCAVWMATCDCGGTTTILSRYFGTIKSCGCLSHKTGRAPTNFKDMTGQKKGRLSILECVGKERTKYGMLAMWRVRCECGKEIVMSSRRVSRANSCGCLYRESRRWKKNVVKCKKHPGAVERTAILWKYKNDARKRSLEWALSDDQFFTLTAKRCHYCGSEPMSVKRIFNNGGCLLWNGVDRVDNCAGYTASNCVPCCKHCNHAKRDMTVAEFISWVKNVYRHCFRKAVEQKEEQPFLFPSGAATP